MLIIIVCSIQRFFLHTSLRRVIIGAPKGTYPGGLDYPDPGDNADQQTGLVYMCPLLPGQCEGLRGDVNLYSGDDDNDFDIAEGRLFDHYRESLGRYV